MIRKLSWIAIFTLCVVVGGCQELAEPRFGVISDSALTPQSTVRLSVIPITGTPETNDQAAIVWSANGSRHFGLLDIKSATVKQLQPSIGDDELSIEIVWSPDGNTFTYRQTERSVFNLTDIFVLRADDSDELHTLLYEEAYFYGCLWSPYGRYIVCGYGLYHGSSICMKVYDSSSWKQIQKYGCPFVPQPSSLPLGNDEFWTLPDANRLWEPIPLAQDTARTVSEEFCKSQVSEEFPRPCYSKANSNGNFVAFRLSGDLLILDIQKSQIWKVGSLPDHWEYPNWRNLRQEWDWSGDGRNFAWIEQGQARVFDTSTYTITSYEIENAEILNIAWSSLP